MSSHKAYSEPFTAQSDLALLSEVGVLPRNINLKAFEPHRAEFKCAIEADRVPAISKEAQALHDSAMMLTSPALWPNERNYVKAVEVWKRAAALGNWKSSLALLGVAMHGGGEDSEKGKFYVAPSNTEAVVLLAEDLMRKGVPDGFALMGDFYDRGAGVPQDASRAWALWELAADMGSPTAQTRIAESLGLNTIDREKKNETKWANQKVKFEMLECAYSQGYGKAAYEFGVWLSLKAEWGEALNNDPAAQFARARKVLHDGVKFGSEDAARYLGSSFRGGNQLTERKIDEWRGDRYRVFSDALWNNPDLRFPNLDAVLPLPPAKLPKWDGDKDKLIEAAKAVRAKPAPAKVAAWDYEGVENVPTGQVISLGRAVFDPKRHVVNNTSYEWDYQGNPMPPKATQDGYWKPTANAKASAYSKPHFEQAPACHFFAGERMKSPRLSGSMLADFDWHYCGQAVPMAQEHSDYLANAGTLRQIPAIPRQVLCEEGKPCTQAGIWGVRLANHHAQQNGLARQWWHQAFVAAGQAMPTLADVGAATATATPAQYRWQLLQSKAQMDKTADFGYDNDIDTPTPETALDPQEKLTAADFEVGGKHYKA